MDDKTIEIIREKRIKAFGLTFCLALQDAMKFGENLMVNDCIDILKERYGKRLEIMKPITIFKKVKHMMGLIESDPDESYIIERVNDYINNG